MLEEPNVEGEPKPFQMARNVYKSCMDKERIEQLGSEPLKKTILDLGGWPVLMGDRWDGSGYIWYEQGCNFYMLKEHSLPLLFQRLP